MNTQNNTKNFLERSQNTVKQGYNQFVTMNIFSQFVSLIVGLLLLGLAIILVMYLYRLSRYGTTGAPMLINEPINSFDPNLSKSSKRLPDASEGMAFTYNFWMYIADWQFNFGKEKTIFVKGTPGNPQNQAPGVFLAPKSNILEVRMVTYADPMGEACSVDNIPLQKWVNVSVVLNNRTLDIYIDGKLERSCVLRGVPRLNKNDLTFANPDTFYGQLSRFQYFNRAITPDEVHQIYTRGPN